MPNPKNFWTVSHADGWAVKREGSDRATSVYDNQADAWADARERAKNAGGEAFLKNQHGRIRERNSYGNDPFPPRG